MSAHPQPPFTVLIVEDEALLALDLEAIIDDAGHRVVGEAMCLKDVEALAGLDAPVLAFVDLHLADGDHGFDVCRCIQRQWPETRIIFVTANAAEVPDDFAGAQGVIPKPFSQVGMLAALRFLEEAISRPPPRSGAPASLRPSPAFMAALAA